MGMRKERETMLYVILALAVLGTGFVAIISCMFSSMLSKEEENRILHVVHFPVSSGTDRRGQFEKPYSLTPPPRTL
jgi:hypothetical protein